MNAVPTVLHPDRALAPPSQAEAGGEPAILVEGLSKRFAGSPVPVLEGVSLSIRKGEIFGIIGRSGAGKSTLVRCLNLLERPTTGRVVVSGREMTALDGRALRRARRDIGMIFQHFNLLTARTVAGNVAFALEVAGVPRAEIATRVPELLDLVGLKDKADSYPSELSGGQKQRVGIARALANRPSVLLCDEATSALDPETTEQILALLKDINRRLGLTIVLITHEMQVLRDIASHVAVLDHGRLVEQGETYDVLAFPQSAVARSFLSGIVAHDLPSAVAARIGPVAGPGTEPILKLVLTGAAADEPVLADLVTRFGVRPHVLHGRIDYVGDRPLGVLTVGLGADEARLGAVVGHLSSLGIHVDVIGHALRSPVARRDGAVA